MRQNFIFTCIIVFTIGLSESYAQSDSWSIVQRAPSLMLSDLCFLSDGQHGYSVGNVSGGSGVLTGIYFTTDGGQNWDKMNFPFSNSVAMNGVFFVSPETGWVYGANGKIYKTIDGGANWTLQASGTSRKLTRGVFLNENEGWIVGGWSDGTQFLVLHTSNGGTNWQNQSFGSTSFACNIVDFTDPLNGWIGGTDNMLSPFIYVTADGGSNWTQQTIPVSAQGTQISSIDFINSLKGWATVTSLYETPAGPVMYTEDGGLTWTIQHYTNLSYNYLDVRDELNIAVIGMSLIPNSNERIAVSSDGGQTWTSASTPIIEYTQGIQYVGDKVWIAASKSIILSTTDIGTTWNWEHYSPALQSMEWISDQVGWAIAGTNVGTDHYALKTTDGGFTWEPDETAPGGAQVIFFDAIHGWMLKEGNAAKISRTIDGGTSWSQYTIGGSNWIGGMFFATPDSGWAFGSNGTLKFTSNGGVNWSNQSVGSSNYVQAVWFASSQEGWAGGGYGGGGGFIAHTTDGGATWDQQSMPYDDHILSFSFTDNKHGWASTVGGTPFITANGGLTWSTGGYISDGSPDQILMINNQTGWIITYLGGSEAGAEIFRTDDGGMSWNLEWTNDWPNAYLTDISMQPGNHLWICGNHNALMQYSVVVTSPENSIETNNSFSIMPNPVRDYARIGFEVKEPSYVRIYVFDITGQAIDMLEDGYFSSGKYELNWNACDRNGNRLPANTYLVSVQVNGKYFTKKIIVE
jgi:photosystem II stability/assembly factor-like uncharacterized protein